MNNGIIFAFLIAQSFSLANAMALRQMPTQQEQKLLNLARYVSAVSSSLTENPQAYWSHGRKQQQLFDDLRGIRDLANELSDEYRRCGREGVAELLIELDLIIGGQVTELTCDLLTNDRDRIPELRSTPERLVSLINARMGEANGILRAVEVYQQRIIPKLFGYVLKPRPEFINDDLKVKGNHFWD